ncbi:hypothetical protein AAZX31_06G208100 [Glycine max]
MKAFKEVTEWYRLIDVGFEGPKFTWKRGNLQVRLDRMLVNQEWGLKFPRAKVTHLYYYKSDHRPFILILIWEGLLLEGGILLSFKQHGYHMMVLIL